MLCNTESITRRGITSKDVKSSSSGLWRPGAAMTRPGLHQAALGPVTTVTLTRPHRSRRHTERERDEQLVTAGPGPPLSAQAPAPVLSVHGARAQSGSR